MSEGRCLNIAYIGDYFKRAAWYNKINKRIILKDKPFSFYNSNRDYAAWV
ncbi:hypothetical protein GCM10008983_10600 [Lentibacillus halophilus]|uniref:Uncharacterized protein n=1 Tax=Lentibacillus halophilus TaxID=295065 RepID=A0ABN0Z6L5_9BACI